MAANCRTCREEVSECSTSRGNGSESTFGGRANRSHSDATGKLCVEDGHGNDWR